MKKYIKTGKVFIFKAVGLFLMGLMLTSCADRENEKEESGRQTSKNVFGSFTSETLEGTEITQDIFAEADLTMVNIWGTFCGPCIREMPELGEISREYGEKAGPPARTK